MSEKQLCISLFLWVWSAIQTGYVIFCIKNGKIQVNQKYIILRCSTVKFWYTIGYNIFAAIISAIVPFLRFIHL